MSRSRTGSARALSSGATCCYARQDRFWVEGVPDGASWEVYTVLGDSQTFYDHDHSGPECCGADASETGQPAESAEKCC